MTHPRDSEPDRRDSWDRDRIVELLLEAGRIACVDRQSLTRDFKPDGSIVTETDRRVERLFGDELENREGGVYLIGEETIESKGDEYVAEALREVAYIVDPIDGTSPYALELPYWGVSVARMQGGTLTDGAIFLPELRQGEILLSAGDDVLEGRCLDGEWHWRPLPPPPCDLGVGPVITISQDFAKNARVRLPNAVHALGSAVFALAGVLQGRFAAYAGSLKLWDVAGCLPLLNRLGFATSHLRDAERRRLEMTVDATHYDMAHDHSFRWGVSGGLLACLPDWEEPMRRALEF